MEIHNKKNTSTVYNRIQLTWKFIGRTCVYYFGSSYISPSGEFQNFIEFPIETLYSKNYENL